MTHLEYWKRFPHTIVFVQPCEVLGTIEALEVLDNNPEVPVLILRNPKDFLTRIIANQTRLRSELVLAHPAVGDKIRITYHGEAKKAPPGMSPTKEFTVEVWPKKPQPEGRPGKVLGEVRPEIGPQAGGK